MNGPSLQDAWDVSKKRLDLVLRERMIGSPLTKELGAGVDITRYEQGIKGDIIDRIDDEKNIANYDKSKCITPWNWYVKGEDADQIEFPVKIKVELVDERNKPTVVIEGSINASLPLVLCMIAVRGKWIKEVIINEMNYRDNLEAYYRIHTKGVIDRGMNHNYMLINTDNHDAVIAMIYGFITFINNPSWDTRYRSLGPLIRTMLPKGISGDDPKIANNLINLRDQFIAEFGLKGDIYFNHPEFIRGLLTLSTWVDMPILYQIIRISDQTLAQWSIA